MKVLKELLEQRKAAGKELRDLEKAVLQDDGSERAFTQEEEKRSNELLAQVDDLDEQIVEEKKREDRKQARKEARALVDAAVGDAAVTSEPMQYGVDEDGNAFSEYSYFADVCRTSPLWPGVSDPGATERLALWAHQVEREIALGSKRGKRAVEELRSMEGIRNQAGNLAARRIAEIRDRGRTALDGKTAEFRVGITTGGGATASSSGGGGAAFVIPVFYEDKYAPYREPGRPFADLVNQQDLPPYGMTVYMPAVQTGALVASQNEGSGIAEQDPTFGFIAGGLITTAGQVTVSQQLLDRAGPNVQFDQIMFDQLRRDYAPKWDKYVLTQALANAGSVTFTGSWAFAAAPGTASFVSKIAGAIDAIEETSGTVMSPTNIVLQNKRWNFLESVGALESSSGNLHPLLVPNQNGPFNAFISGNPTGQVNYEGDTGYKLFGLPMVKDINVPVPGAGADQAIVLNRNEVFAYEGPLVPRVVPQTLAPNLAVLLQVYSYGTALVRYPNAVQTVSGTGMAAITF